MVVSRLMSNRGCRPRSTSRALGHLPARVARAIARDALHRLDQFMIVDTAIVGAGHRTQFGAAIFGLEGLHLLGAVVG